MSGAATLIGRGALVLVLGMAGTCWAQRPAAPVRGPRPAAQGEQPAPDFSRMPSYPVMRVVDATTLMVSTETGPQAVRLIGVDPPRAAAPARGAAPAQSPAQYLGKLIQGKAVFLEPESGQLGPDQSGKVPAYVYRAPDGLFVNRDLIAQGHARVSATVSFRLHDAFQAAEQEAKAGQLGLWAGNPAADAASAPAKGKATTTKTAGQPRAAGKAAAKASDEADPEEETVILPKGSKRYHREGCRLAAKGGASLTLDEAKRKKLEACKVCKPGQAVASSVARSKKRRYQSQAEQRQMLEDSLGSFDPLGGAGAGGGAGGGAASPY